MSFIKAIFCIVIVYSVFISEYISANSCVSSFSQPVINVLESKLKNSQIDLHNIKLGPIYINQDSIASFVISMKYNNKVIANILLERVSENRNLYETHINIKDVAYKEKGLGAFLYLAANVLASQWGLKIVSSLSPSLEAQKVHQKFKTLGMSKIVSEGLVIGSRYHFEYDQIKIKEPILWSFIQKNVEIIDL